jgi:non-specific serine/threonine protein kinase
VRGLQHLEAGDARPYPATLRALAAALSLTEENLAALSAAAGRRAVLRRAARVAPAPDVAPIAAGARAAGRLPEPLTGFVGRRRELARLQRLLAGEPGGHKAQPRVRLLTLMGVGGVGKTRLAQEAARAAAAAYSDGVWFVDLAPLADAALVPQAVATALGVREEPGRALGATLTGAVRQQRLLLLLDNCEHLLDGVAALVPELLTRCPGVTILATSRSPLRLSGEQVFAVAPLGLPGRSPAGSRSRLRPVAGAEAVRLFVARARAARSDFALTSDNAAAVAEVCRRLDGLPLAIELAAARASLLPPPALLALLERRLPLLTGGARDLPARQRTLRATLDWSQDLLAPDQRRLLARLAVFAGGWDLEGATSVGGLGRHAGSGLDVLQAVDALIDQSLVRRHAAVAGQPRFAMLEIVREYARERLEASGELDAARGQHAAYFTALIDRATAGVNGPEHATWLQRIEAEQDNIRAVLQWAIECGHAELALRLAGDLAWFWGELVQVSEGRRWLTAALAPAGAWGPSAAKARALGALANFAGEQGDWDEAEALHREALGDWRTLDDQLEVARRLEGLGLLRLKQGDPAAAATLLEQCLELNQRFGTPRHVSNTLNLIALARTHQGEYEAARRVVEQALAIDQAEENRPGVSHALSTLGLLYEEQGDYARAQASYEQSLAIREALHRRSAAARVRLNVAEVAMLQGDAPRAWRLYTQSLPVLRAQGDQLTAARGLEGLAVLAADQSWYECALRLAGAAAAARSAAAPPGERRRPRLRLEAALAAAREALGEADGDRALRAGMALSLAQAIEEAERVFESRALRRVAPAAPAGTRPR